MDKEAVVKKLEEICGPENVLHSDMDPALYIYDASLEKAKPDVVVLPDSTEEVSRILALAHAEKIPVVGRGSGTNLTGGTVPVKGGIVVHFSRMNRVLETSILPAAVDLINGPFLARINPSQGGLGGTPYAVAVALEGFRYRRPGL